ncbi:hypothetical protein GCM10009007_10930 [Formosimonas limnophila]|uniref:Uncharacterized protein n=1 Tax=Formosimonas limnophila TaxID=1384487 RepID=A0A8J3FZU3_9BURK|nr:tryptophan 7-halogenase [Formosimonas limnophila]GHA71836.1 hypothetical protein GCM10009007_10930 [Formosimonas limnophila]
MPCYSICNTRKNSSLLKQAIAMNADWMWQIALQELVIVGYVLSGKHMNAEHAADEVKSCLGFD